jgi:hypothetical protein
MVKQRYDQQRRTTCARRKGPRKTALAPPSNASPSGQPTSLNEGDDSINETPSPEPDPVPTTPPDRVKCPHCGAVCSAKAEICPACHQPLSTQQPSVQSYYQPDVLSSLFAHHALHAARDTSSSSLHYSAAFRLHSQPSREVTRNSPH